MNQIFDSYATVVLGLGGDGDEIAAIEEVETAFGVRLDDSDAGNWSTVGDIHTALMRALSPEEAAKPDVWARFAEAISRETGVDPTRIGPDTDLLLASGGWGRVASAAGWFGMLLIGGLIGLSLFYKVVG